MGRAIGEIPQTKNDAVPVLYNIKDDPEELSDVSSQFPEVFKTLQVKLEDWCREVEFSRNQNRDYGGARP
jgi:hypothetical protein